MEALQIDKFVLMVQSSGDPRGNEYPLVSDPIVSICAVLAYLLLIYVGKKIMMHRQPLNLRSVIVVYNLLLVLLSVWMVHEFLATSILRPNFSPLCEDINPADRSQVAMRMVFAFWVFYVSKYVELLDTMFFVLRKKNGHITFLHVFHHVVVVLYEWATVKYTPGGMAYIGPLMNSFVHTVMYSYYFLAAIGVDSKYLWWKRHLTQIQITQFLINLVYVPVATYIGCEFNRLVLFLGWLFAAVLIILFMNFYIRSYKESLRRKKE